MTIDATPDTFSALVAEGVVLVDVWGPRCAPCLALIPEVESLADRYRGRARLVKVNAPENRAACRDLQVMGLPTYLVFREGAEVARLTGEQVTIGDIEQALVAAVTTVETAEGGEPWT